MIRARFRMTLADDIWPYDVSTSFPDATLRLLTGVPKGDRALELGEAHAEDPVAISSAIRQHSDIVGYDELYLDDSRVIGQYEADEKSLYEFLWESTLPPEFPIIVEDGEMEFNITATTCSSPTTTGTSMCRGTQPSLRWLTRLMSIHRVRAKRSAEPPIVWLRTSL